MKDIYVCVYECVCMYAYEHLCVCMFVCTHLYVEYCMCEPDVYKVCYSYYDKYIKWVKYKEIQRKNEDKICNHVFQYFKVNKYDKKCLNGEMRSQQILSLKSSDENWTKLF